MREVDGAEGTGDEREGAATTGVSGGNTNVELTLGSDVGKNVAESKLNQAELDIVRMSREILKTVKSLSKAPKSFIKILLPFAGFMRSRGVNPSEMNRTVQ